MSLDDRLGRLSLAHDPGVLDIQKTTHNHPSWITLQDNNTLLLDLSTLSSKSAESHPKSCEAFIREARVFVRSHPTRIKHEMITGESSSDKASLNRPTEEHSTSIEAAKWSKYYEPPSPQNPFNLLGLPVEVRVQIYSEMVEPYIYSYDGWGNDIDTGTTLLHRQRAHIPLYSICRETRDIAKAWFGDTNDPPFDPRNDTLRLQVSLPWSSHLSYLLPPRYLDDGSPNPEYRSRLSDDFQSRTRRLELECRRSWKWGLIFQFLPETLVHFPRLESITFSLSRQDSCITHRQFYATNPELFEAWVNEFWDQLMMFSEQEDGKMSFRGLKTLGVRVTICRCMGKP